MNKYKDFAIAYYSKQNVKTANEEALKKAIDTGEVTPDMSLRKIGTVIGVDNPQIIRHYLMKFLKESES